ncbi:prepilin-type N-terminal cleavage/methylation domain-containing protein [Motilimonas cestriensis]|uniref:Prepilin-type N-terminal cleavage/methylation domain-containing protein n=1 Tax=Motilimonas cestriensis TaxID=2742685 RepID=A0ABS8W8K3_9GAMM|nr:prepilin-type N-terminal cleavage/methylation domain-containing protein [Motilimonas cestriensis]MCE2594692.1 prepilin-type N-terminal cleavage/methylation domain-containing protein [Motilimonas cestriensis]
MIFRKHYGFGLLEVLISLLVISVGVAGIVGLQKHMRQKSAEAEEYLISARMAQQSLEDAKGFTKTSFATVVSAGTLNFLSGASNSQASIAGISFKRTVDVTDVALVTSGGLTTETQLKQMEIKYDWKTLNGASKAQSLIMPISPVSPFETDRYFSISKTGVGLTPGGTVVSSAPATEMDPYNKDHIPPTYAPNYTYSANDQVIISGVKYSCVSAAWCRDDTTYGPSAAVGNFQTAWNICRDVNLEAIKCPVCYDAGGNPTHCPQCTTGAGKQYYCPPTPAPSPAPSPAP